jgi:hypothetical protein
MRLTWASKSGSLAKGTRSTCRASGSGGDEAVTAFTSKKAGRLLLVAVRTAAKCVATDGAKGKAAGKEPSGRRSPDVFES